MSSEFMALFFFKIIIILNIMDKNGKTTHRLNIYYTVLKALIMSSTLRLLMQ